MDRAPQVILVVAVVAIIHLKSNLFLGLGYEKGWLVKSSYPVTTNYKQDNKELQ